MSVLATPVNFLLDTNVVSEWTKPRPDAGVVRWLAQADEDRVYLSTVTLAELRHGVERLSAGVKRDRLDAWLADELPARFERRVLPVDAGVADRWGRMAAGAQATGRPIGAMDCFLAATAAEYGLTLVTRNLKNFEATGVQTLNPWAGGAA